MPTEIEQEENTELKLDQSIVWWCSECLLLAKLQTVCLIKLRITKSWWSQLNLCWSQSQFFFIKESNPHGSQNWGTVPCLHHLPWKKKKIQQYTFDLTNITADKSWHLSMSQPPDQEFSPNQSMHLLNITIDPPS